MATSKSMQKSKTVKNDEFYTQYEDVEREVNSYLDFNVDTFKNKVIMYPINFIR